MKRLPVIYSCSILLMLITGCSRVYQSPITVTCPAISSEKIAQLPPDLQEVQQLLTDERPRKAQMSAEKWAKDNPNSSFLDYALFFQAEGLFGQRLYYQSFNAYEKLLEKYPATDLFAPALYREVKIATLFLGGTKRKIWKTIPIRATTDGEEMLERVVEHWPGSELAATVLMIQGDYYYATSRYPEAQQTYQTIVDYYSSSQYYEPAFFRSAEATYAQYEGYKYDTSCLANARVRYEQYRLRFPELARQKDVDQTIAEIQDLQVEKEYQIAQFYKRTGETATARYYWTRINTNQPESKWAQLSRKMLEKTTPAAEVNN